MQFPPEDFQKLSTVLWPLRIVCARMQPLNYTVRINLVSTGMPWYQKREALWTWAESQLFTGQRVREGMIDYFLVPSLYRLRYAFPPSNVSHWELLLGWEYKKAVSWILKSNIFAFIDNLHCQVMLTLIFWEPLRNTDMEDVASLLSFCIQLMQSMKGDCVYIGQSHCSWFFITV